MITQKLDKNQIGLILLTAILLAAAGGLFWLKQLSGAKMPEDLPSLITGGGQVNAVTAKTIKPLKLEVLKEAGLGRLVDIEVPNYSPAVGNSDPFSTPASFKKNASSTVKKQ